MGTTLGFNYYQQTDNYLNSVTNATEKYRTKLPTYSLSVYARYLISNYFIVNIEPELSNTKFVLSNVHDPSYTNSTTGKYVERSIRKTFGAFLVGGGYAQRIGRYGYGYFMVCYDLVQNPNLRKYYSTLDYRTGIMIDLWNK